MKALNIATAFTNINDLYINEAAEMPYATAVIPVEKRRNGFVRFLNSGWGVAVICALVAIAVTVGIIAAGQTAEPVVTLPGAGPTHPTFAFDYELDPKQDTYLPGDTFTVKTEVKNLGIPFTVKGSSQEFSAIAWLVPHGSADVYAAEGRINGDFAFTEDYMVQTIDQGDVGKHSGIITIPEDAAVGEYDLVLAYGEEYQVFEKAVTVVRSGRYPDGEDVTLHFDPNLSQSEYICGETVTIDFSIRGIDPLCGDPYIQGSSLQSNYVLFATLTRHGMDFNDTSAIAGRIEPNTIANTTCSNLTWRFYHATFEIPSNAIGGSYDLHLRYINTEEGYETEVESITENVLTVRSTHSRFDFHYSIVNGSQTFERGKSYEIATAVTNLGEAFTITDNSKSFSAEAQLVPQQAINQALVPHVSYPEDEVTLEITTGYIGRYRVFFTIPEDAPTGVYDLVLFYGGEAEVFEGAITVIDPIVVPPLSTVNGYEGASTERLKGFTYDEFIRAWGHPQGSGSGANVCYWRVPNQASFDYVTVWFDGSNVSEAADYSYVMKVTVTETAYEGNPSFLLVEPYGDRRGYEIFVSLHNTSIESLKDSIEAGTILYVTYSGGINETAPPHFANQKNVTLEPPVPERLWEIS